MIQEDIHNIAMYLSLLHRLWKQIDKNCFAIINVFVSVPSAYLYSPVNFGVV